MGRTAKGAEAQENTNTTGSTNELENQELLERLKQLEKEAEEAKAEAAKAKEEADAAKKEAEEAEAKAKAEADAKIEEIMKESLEREKNIAPLKNPEEKNMVKIKLYKDKIKKDAVFVAVNGETYQIQRGVEVEVPDYVKEVLDNSYNQEMIANERAEELQKLAEDHK